MPNHHASETTALYASIEAGLGTDLHVLKEARAKIRDDILRTDQQLAALLNDPSLAQKLGIDVLSKISVDEDGIADLQKREAEQNNSTTSSRPRKPSPYTSCKSVNGSAAMSPPPSPTWVCRVHAMRHHGRKSQ